MKKIIFTILTMLPVYAFAAEYGKLKETSARTPTQLVGTVQNYLVGLTGGAAMLFIIYGGFLYITSRGNKQQAEKAKKTLTYAFLGLILVILARTILLVLNGDILGTFITGGNL